MALFMSTARVPAHRLSTRRAPALGLQPQLPTAQLCCPHPGPGSNTCPRSLATTPSCLRPWAHLQHNQGRHTQVRPGLRQVAAASALPAATSAAAAAASGDWSQILAVLLGYAVLVGSCFRSVPQIVKVIRNSSCEGLSLTSNAVELICFTIMVAYNIHNGYAFNTYGEIFACWLQDLLLVAMILRHNGVSGGQLAVSTGAFAALCAFLFLPGVCPPALLATLQLSTLFIMAIGSRVPQILLNMKRGNAGVMSLTTCLLNVAGNVIRTFTTLVLTHDKLLLVGCITQGVLNTIILVQVLQTKRQQAEEASRKQQEKQQEAAPAANELPGPTMTEPEPQFLPQLA